MFRIGFLLCIAIGVRSVTGQVNTFPNTLQYTCEPSSSDNVLSNYKIRIQLDGTLSTNSGIYAFKQVHNVQEECKSKKEGNSYLITGCWNVNVTVVISKTDNIIGGEGSKVYTLQCVGPYADSNVMINVSKDVEYVYTGLTNVLVQNTSFAVSFEMSITDESGNSKTTYHVGDSMKLSIAKTTGISDIHWNVTKCIARSGQDFDFYDGKQFKPSSLIAASYVGYTGGTLDNFIAKLYAFHGKNETKVTYECSIAVCRGDQAGSKCTISTRRRRSSVNSNVVARTIYVLDTFEKVDQDNDSGSFGIRGSPLVKILACVFVLIWVLK